MWMEDTLTGKEAHWCVQRQSWYITHYLSTHLITIREYIPRTRIEFHTPF